MISKSKILHGLSWSLISRIGVQAFQFAFGIALARTLSPTEFGVFGMLIAFTGFAQVLAEGGLNAALIHKQDATEIDQSTAFWLQVFAGLVLSLAFFFAAPFIADFYETPVLTPLTQFVAWVFLIQSFGQTHYAQFAKGFRFKALAVANVAGMFVSGVVAIALALNGYGVWALAWQAVTGPATNCIVYWFQSRWRPRFVFSWQSAGTLWRYSVYLLGHMSLNYWLRNGDKLVIGKFLGASQLGHYSRAYTLMLLPLNNIGAVVGQVMFPALSEIQHDLPRFGRIYLASLRMMALVAFPLMMGMAALAEPFILTLLGDKWQPVIPILQILSLVGMFQSIVFPVGWVFTALGKTKAQFHLSILFAAIFVIAMIVGLPGGVIGISYAYAVCAFVCGIIVLHVAGGYMGISLGLMLSSLWRILAMSIVMGAAVYLLDRELTVILGTGALHAQVIRLVVGTVVGGLFFLVLCLVTRDPTFKQGLDIVLGAFKKRRAVPSNPA
jgi:PST family polysaccharide transporter